VVAEPDDEQEREREARKATAECILIIAARDKTVTEKPERTTRFTAWAAAGSLEAKRGAEEFWRF
jgi:hypothetical protein